MSAQPNNAAPLRKPPHSVEAERSLLGGLMLDRRAWPRVASLVSPADFYRADHRLIFGAIRALEERGNGADPTTVAEQLLRHGHLEAAGGAPYLAQLVEDTPSARNVETYARMVREHATVRALIDFGRVTSELAHDRGDRRAEELIAEAAEALARLQAGARTGRGLVGSSELVTELLDDLERRRSGERGVSVGLSDFDALTLGLEPGDLVVIAGRPGMGKTALLVSIAAHVSRSTGVAAFSAEMPAQQLMRRCVALLGGISQGRLRRPDALAEPDWRVITDATGALAQRRLFVDDTPAPRFTHVRAEVLALRARAELGLVLVDYAQLLQGSGDNRYEQLRDVAYGAKNLAKEARVPVILLAQLNRGVERRDSKRPTLSDLRDSGAIEEAADIVGMLYSEGYYDSDFSMPYVLECTLEKNRNGERGECLWRFAGECSRVSVLEDGAREHYRRLRAQARRRAADDDL